MKALRLLISEKKNFEVCLLCSYLQHCDSRGRASFDPWGTICTNWLRSTRRCCIPIIKTLHLPVLENNFEDGLLCSHVPTCDPWDGASFDPRRII